MPGRPGGAEREKLLAGYRCQREGVWACAGCLDGLAALNELRLNDCRVAALPAGLAAAQRLRILDLGHNPVRRAKDLQVGCEHAPHHASSNSGFHQSVSWVFWVSVFASFRASMYAALCLNHFALLCIMAERSAMPASRAVAWHARPAASGCKPHLWTVVSAGDLAIAGFTQTKLQMQRGRAEAPANSTQLSRQVSEPVATVQVLARLLWLRSLNLVACPLAASPDYIAAVHRLVPSLQVLD